LDQSKSEKEISAMSDKVIGGRGHKISPVGKGTTGKLAYSYMPCPKLDGDMPDNCLGILPTPNGNFKVSPLPRKIFILSLKIDKTEFLIPEKKPFPAADVPYT
jgi:hypothetical protein